MRPFGLLEVARSGHVAMARGSRAGCAHDVQSGVEDVPDNVSYSV
jgi:hypothetical protein